MIKKLILHVLMMVVASIACAQKTELPKKDKVVHNKNGSTTRYTVSPDAVFMDTEKDGVPNGPHKAFYPDGQLWEEDNRVNGQLDGRAIEYTPRGDTAMLQEWKQGRLYSEVIFYSNSAHGKDNKRYYFVSKKGFSRVSDGYSVKLDKTTVPDSLIEEGVGNAYMWIKGERKLLWGKPDDKYAAVTKGNKPGMYKMEGDSIGEFFRPFTEGEKKMFMKELPPKKEK
jgi:hypothetical protein